MTRQILYRGQAVTVRPNETDVEAVRRFEEKLRLSEQRMPPLQPPSRSTYSDLEE